MLGLKAKGFYLPLLKIVGRGEGAETSGLKIALVVDVTPAVIEDPLNQTGVRKERKTILKDRT